MSTFTDNNIPTARKADLYKFLKDNHIEQFDSRGDSLKLKEKPTVSVKSGFNGYKDFASDDKGNSIDFLTNYLGYNFQDAVKALLPYGRKEDKHTDCDILPFDKKEDKHTDCNILSSDKREDECMDDDILPFGYPYNEDEPSHEDSESSLQMEHINNTMNKDNLSNDKVIKLADTDKYVPTYDGIERWKFLNKIQHLPEFEKHLLSKSVIAFRDGLDDQYFKIKYPTGFPELDKYLHGGIPEGLTCIGALSSAGKSTLMLQIAENIATMKKPVIYFSLEMSKWDIAAKSVSRQSYVMNDCNSKVAVSSEELLTKEHTYDKTIVTKASVEASDRCETLVVVDSSSEPLYIETICSYVNDFVTKTGTHPVVIIDYLQYLHGKDKECGDNRQVMDDAVQKIKELALANKLAIILISSFNRNSYKKEPDMDSFKESGMIEYTCDIVLSLQCRETTNSSTAEVCSNSEQVRDMELKIIKNRYGEKDVKIKLMYNPKFNYFEDSQHNGNLTATPTNPFSTYISE